MLTGLHQAAWLFKYSFHMDHVQESLSLGYRGIIQREYSSKPLKHCIVEHILVFKW